MAQEHSTMTVEPNRTLRSSMPAELVNDRISDVVEIRNELIDLDVVKRAKFVLDDDGRPEGVVEVVDPRALVLLSYVADVHDLRVSAVEQRGCVHQVTDGNLEAFDSVLMDSPVSAALEYDG